MPRLSNMPRQRGTPSEPKDTRYYQCRASTAATTSSTSQEVPRLNNNDDGMFTLDGKLYPLKAFVPEEIYLGKLPKDFQDALRENNMDQSTNTD